MRPVLVVFGLPSFKFSSKIPFMFEMPSLVELLGVAANRHPGQVGYSLCPPLEVREWATQPMIRSKRGR
jgi:hypothetical protein